MIHIFTTTAIAVTAVLLLVTSRALLGTAAAGFLAGLLYPLISSAAINREMMFEFSSLEHFQAPWLMAFILGFLLSLQRQRPWLDRNVSGHPLRIGPHTE